MSEAAGLAFVVVLIAELLMLGSLGVSIFKPTWRVWPPPGRRTWQFHWAWALTLIIWFGLHALALLDWNSFVYSHWSRFAVGGVLFGGGALLALWGIRTLSVRNSLGLKGAFVTRGPYRLSRNPQYVGDIVLLIGMIFIANSVLVLVTGVLAALLFALAPFTEEPWLRARFGRDYGVYCQCVPRFLKAT